MAECLRNIALVGASGNLGSKLLELLLKQEDEKNITVVTRSSSRATYPSSVKVKRGEYSDARFLELALRGQDVLVIMLGFAAPLDQDRLIQAAAKASVQYVLPIEYGAPSGDENQRKAIPIVKAKKDVHDLIESLGMKWVAVITNPWIDYCLQYGVFSIQISDRQAQIYTDAAPFVTTSVNKAAAGMAAMLRLPAAIFEDMFANNYLYLSSFVLTQPEIFSAVLRVTGTKEKVWQIKETTTQDLIDEGHKMVDAGDTAGHFKILLGVQYQPGMGGDYSAQLHNDMLGLVQEDLDEVIRAAVEAASLGGWDAASTLALRK